MVMHPSRGDEPEKPADKPAGPMAKVSENLFKARTILLFGEINQKVSESISAQLLALAEENNEPIRMIINSPGGHVESGDTIHDIVRFVRPKVQVIGTGWVASAGCHIFLAAAKENRYCLPNTRFMIHQPAGGAGGQATDIAIQAKEIVRIRERIARVIARQTGKPYETVLADMERDFWMSAEEAVAYGIAARIIERQDQIA